MNHTSRVLILPRSLPLKIRNGRLGNIKRATQIGANELVPLFGVHLVHTLPTRPVGVRPPRIIDEHVERVASVPLDRFVHGCAHGRRVRDIADFAFESAA